MQIFYYFCSVKKIFFIVFVISCFPLLLSAEDKEAYRDMRNEIRIGWGDQLFESLVWHNPTIIVTTMPLTYRQTNKENYRYSQHIWLEYQWRFFHWLSVGAMFDGSGVVWDQVTRNGAGGEIERLKGQHFYNLVLMPTVRFTYYHHPNVNLYSSIGLGLDINGGTEKNIAGKTTDFGIVTHGTVFGVSANYERWFMTVDFGGTIAMRNTSTIFMALSRIINVSIGARF